MKKFILLLILICCNLQLAAQNKQSPSPILFIYDASGSMWGQLEGKPKIEIANTVLTNSIQKFPNTQKVGIVAYGHRKKGDCKDVEFLVAIENGTKTSVINAVKNIKPLGKTPLAYAALQAIKKLKQTNLKATIILITDGIESCGGNICETILAAKKEGIDFKLHIIGFGLKNENTQNLKCAAKAGEGNYYNAENASELSAILENATSNSVDTPKNNFSVFALKNGVPIDAWIKAYDTKSKRKPIMVRTYQDTAFMYLPPSIYNFEVVPLAGSDVKKITVPNIESFENKIAHQTFSFDGGILGITTTNNGNNWDCMVKILDQNNKTVAATRTYNKNKEIEVNPGKYNVSIQALKINGLETFTILENITIQAGKTTPISYNYKTGDFNIFTKIGEENIDTIVTITEANSGKHVASSRTYDRGATFLLNPATYQVKVVPLGKNKDRKTQNFTITIEPKKLITKEITF